MRFAMTPDVFSRGAWEFPTTPALIVFAQLRKYATIAYEASTAVRTDNLDNLS
jgi:hypothetical protein